ncbi:Toll/interleukin-1 receptor domain-containing protein, partial [Tanacetum coccineum]
GTKDTTCISVNTHGFESFEVQINGLANMTELRFLDMHTPEVSIDRIWDFDKVNLYLPNSLRFIDQLWDDGEQKVLSKLKFLSLHSSLLRTLDLRSAPNVEKVSIVDSYLADLHMPAESPKLISLHLENTKLTILHLGITKNLENLSLKFFDYLVELHMPAKCLKLKSLELSHLILRTLHLGITLNLESLNLQNCTDMFQLQIPAESPKLVNLDLHNLNLRTLHLGIAPNLRFLYLSCLNLRTLEFSLTLTLESLDLEDCYLEELKLQGWSIRKAPEHLDELECLDELSLWSTDIKYLPDNICLLKNLKFLELKFNRYLEKLPDDIGQLESLEELILHECLVL